MLEQIKSPKELKDIPIDKLPLLAEEIRSRIVSVVSQCGGHLASSLGAVDLTIALHYCLNAPQDKIIWDVGHQSYAHKILTGRNPDFEKLRRFGGISGFPSWKESVYDPFTTGHSSASVSLALGLAVARDLAQKEEKVVAVVGDGSLSGGMCFEALNQAGHTKSDLIVVLNTNEMSISANVGALSTYVNKIISMPVYNRLRSAVDNFMKLRIPRIGPRLAKLAERFEEMAKGMIIPGIFFEELGFRYFGPFDGHNIENLIVNFKNISVLKGPIIFHVVTKKGKGYAPAEAEPERFHGISSFDMKTGEGPKSKESYTSVFGKHLLELAKEDKAIIAITAAMAQGTGLDGFARELPARFFDVGIAEQNAVGFAAGLAKGGFKPVVVIYSTFLQRSYDQIIEEACLQNLPIVFCIDRSGLVGQDGPTHHGVLDISYLRNLPNIIVMAPAHKKELEDMLSFSLTQRNLPVAIRYPRDNALDFKGECPQVSLGKSQVVMEGKGVVLLSVGTMLENALEIREILARHGMNPKVINARFIKPLDEDMVRSLAENGDFIFTIEEGCVEGGFGSAVLEFLTKNSLINKCSVYNFGLPSEFITYGERKELLGLCGLLPQQIAEKIVSLVKERKV